MYYPDMLENVYIMENIVMRLAVVGTGLKAVEYAQSWLKLDIVEIVAIADTDPVARDKFLSIFQKMDKAEPSVFSNINDLLENCSEKLDAVYLATPHAFHADGAIATLNHGLHLLLEKPMVTTMSEARALKAASDASGCHVVIAYQGALSVLVQDTIHRAQTGEFGKLVSVSATIWEDWSDRYAGQWKQNPEISGGGFMFDTGAHMMNAVCLLSGSEFDCVSALMNNHGKSVDIVTTVNARLKTNTLVTLNATGLGPQACSSHIMLFYEKATINIDAWGKWREISTASEKNSRESAEVTDNPLLAFIDIVAGKAANPSTIENGIRFAQLWDAIKVSAANEGKMTKVETVGIAT